MDNYFNKLNDHLFTSLSKSEILKTSIWGESSQFIRLNNSKVRQTGIIDDLSFSLSLISDEKQVSCSTTLNGNLDYDTVHLSNILNSLRADIAVIITPISALKVPTNIAKAGVGSGPTRSTSNPIEENPEDITGSKTYPDNLVSFPITTRFILSFLDNIYPADLAILRQVSGVIGSILTFERIPSVPNNLTIWPFI